MLAVFTASLRSLRGMPARARSVRRLRGLLWLVLGLSLLWGIGRWLPTRWLGQELLERSEDIALHTEEHLQLVLLSGGLAILTGVPLGFLISRPHFRVYAEWAMQGVNLTATVPVLAVMALTMSVLGIGTTPAVFTLWLSTLLPIVRNTYAGACSVAPSQREAAQGIGMQPRQILFWVEIPAALPAIFAGIRTGLTINVGTVPLAFLIGGGGLGTLIFTGIALNEPGMMLAGALPTAGLAILTDAVLAALAWLIQPSLRAR